MVEPLEAAIAEIARMHEDQQLEAAQLLRIFIQGRIRIERHPLDREKDYPQSPDW